MRNQRQAGVSRGTGHNWTRLSFAPTLMLTPAPFLLWPHLLQLVLAPVPHTDAGYRVDPSQGLHSYPFLEVCFTAVSRPKAGQKAEMKRKWNKKETWMHKGTREKAVSWKIRENKHKQHFITRNTSIQHGNKLSNSGGTINLMAVPGLH